MSNQNMSGEIASTIKRKIVTAILSSLLFALIFSTIGDGFEADAFFGWYYLNLMIVMTYGVITSFLSDWFSRKLSKKVYIRESASFLFHCFFGIILKVVSLVSAILFFIVDRLLKKVKIGWLTVIIALLIVVLVFIIMISR